MQLLNNGLMKLVLLVVVDNCCISRNQHESQKVRKTICSLSNFKLFLLPPVGGYTLMGSAHEEPEEENSMPSPANGELEMPNDTVGNAANVVIEGFQGNEDEEGV